MKEIKRLLVSAMSLCLLGTLTISSVHAEEEIPIETEEIEIYVDYEQTEVLVMPAYTLRGTEYAYTTTTPVVGVPPNAVQSMILGYIYCGSIFELGTHQALGGNVNNKKIMASTFSTQNIHSTIVERYATNEASAAQIRYFGTASWTYHGTSGNVPFNLSHYMNIYNQCFNSPYGG